MIPETHPIRVIKRMCDEVLASLSQQLDGIYAADGAPSIPPETLLKGKVLQALYTVRSDRQLCDRLKTVGADTGYHNQDFIHGARRLGVAPHPALKPGQNPLRVRLTATPAFSQLICKRIEEIIGWGKTMGNFRKSRYRGVARTNAQGQYVAIACNLVRLAKLSLGPPGMARA